MDREITQGDDPAFFMFLEALPIAKMFFRPEEIHRTSGIVGRVEYPFSKRY